MSADQKLEEALNLVESAQEQMSRAAEKLCPLCGACEEWEETLALYEEIKAHWYRLEKLRGKVKE